MRHCPLALEGAASTMQDIDGGVRFVVSVPANQIEEVHRRARHIVEFAAKRTREGHSGFDAKGGGHMKNCPVVTDGVRIEATDVATGAQLDVLTLDAAQLGALRTETRGRIERFPFVGATIKVGAAP